MRKILYTILIVALIIVIGLLLSIIAMNLYYFSTIINKTPIIIDRSLVDYVTIMLACVALCFSISVVIPYFLSNQIIKKEIEKTVNDIFNSDYKIELNNAINALERGDADHSRMTALFLQKHEMYIWSIGWICRSILRYLKCDDIPKQKMYNNIVKMCIPILIDNISMLVKNVQANKSGGLTETIIRRFNIENSEDKNSLIIRTLTDIIDYRLMSSKYSGKFKALENSEQKHIINLFITLVLTTIPEKELAKCGDISWFGTEAFSENILLYKSTLSNEDVFRKLLQGIAKNKKKS